MTNLDARAKAFLDRIAPLSADLEAHGRTRALALKKLRRICEAEVRRLKASHTPATVKFYLSKYRDAIRQIDPNHLVLRPSCSGKVYNPPRRQLDDIILIWDSRQLNVGLLNFLI